MTVTFTEDVEETSMHVQNKGFNRLEQIAWAQLFLADRIKEFENAYILKVIRKPIPKRKNEPKTDKT